jgi:hypothetical protein
LRAELCSPALRPGWSADRTPPRKSDQGTDALSFDAWLASLEHPINSLAELSRGQD